MGRYQGRSAVVCLSGGLDSAVLAYYLLAEGVSKLRLVTIDYGQRNALEIQSALSLALDLRLVARSKIRVSVEHRVVDLSESLKPLLKGSALTDDTVAVPEGHYQDPAMKANIVPNRNMVLIAIAGAWAVSTRSDFVAYAAAFGARAIYPDSRLEFAAAMNTALLLCDDHKVTLEYPFVGMTKAEIVSLGDRLGVPFEKTYSCYQGERSHCGTCGTCVGRREAFTKAGVTDPTLYAGK